MFDHEATLSASTDSDATISVSVLVFRVWSRITGIWSQLWSRFQTFNESFQIPRHLLARSAPSRRLLEVLPTSPSSIHGYGAGATGAEYARNSAAGGSYTAAAAAVLRTQLAIQAWFRSVLDARSRSSHLSLSVGDDPRYLAPRDWVEQRPPAAAQVIPPYSPTGSRVL